MAIYHLHVKVIQRSKGKNTIAAAAYRRATTLYDEKEGKEWDYTNKLGVIHTEILVPANSPLWVQEFVNLHQTDPSQAAEKLWSMVEASEKRVDSQLAREIEFALLLELSQEQNIQLAREFIQDQFVLRGMIADWSVHWDEGNPHVHVMLTMRELHADGFGKRVLEWNSKALLLSFRQKWAEYANFHLRMHQHAVKIDHRSYVDQGIDLVPTLHQGKAVSDMDRRGIATHIMGEANEIRRENLSRISADPNILLNKLSVQSETFTGHQLGQELGRYINDQGKFSLQDKGFLATAALQNIESLEHGIPSNSILTPEDIATILNSIAHHDSVFSERVIAKAVAPFTQNAEQFAKAIVQIKSSPDLLSLGAGDDGRDRFTTRKMFHLENDLQKVADVMRESRHVKISARLVHQMLEKHQSRLGKRLTDEQMRAVKHILKASSIRCLVGRAGTGKSFSLGAAKIVWEAQGLRVQGVTLSGVAADGLSQDAGIQSRTIESFRYAIETGVLTLNHHDVIVMDEAGMTDSVSMMAVLKAVREARAKLVLVGDHAQIQPVGPGASFRALLERLGFAEIQTVYRQQSQWQRDATVAFSAGRVADGLAAYEAHDCIHFARTEQDARLLLVNDWFNTRASVNDLSQKNAGEHFLAGETRTNGEDLSQHLVIAHRNEDVNDLNTLLRAERIQRGEIVEGYTVKAKRGEMKIAQGDRIVFLKNDRRLGVSNGRFATIKSVDFTESGKVIRFTALLDGENKEIGINPNEYHDFAYGYCATVHKVQGMTVDHALVYAGGFAWNRHLTYVALSRHRKTCHLYADKTTHRESQTLKRHLGRLGLKDSLLDFPLAFAQRRGIDTSGLLKLLPKHLAERLKVWTEKIAEHVDQVIDPEGYARRSLDAAREKLDAETTTQRREDARLVAAYVDTHREVGMAWQALQSKLTTLGLDTMTYEAQAFALISGTQEYSAFQTALRSRDANAFHIMQDASRYEKAITIYELDLNKLKNQAEHHICYERIKQYANVYKKGAVVHRDRLAAEIAQNIKGHYPYLQSVQMDGREVNTHAISHLRRQLFQSLTTQERDAFRVVEDYQSTVKQIGDWWSTEVKTAKNGKKVIFGKSVSAGQGHGDAQSKKPLTRFVLERLETLGRARDRLADQILKDRVLYDKALDFYQIGIATPRFGEKPTEQQMRQAQARWYKLQQSAARHALSERVATYHHALFLGDMNTRMRLAYDIVQDTSAHHRAVVELGMNTKEVWRAIRQDAKRYERYDHYRHLDLIERVGFKTVETYVEAKHAHANAWREIFESKKTAHIDVKKLYSIVVSGAARYTQERNQLAAKILENILLYQAGLDYFKIKPEELQPQAHTHQCRVAVEHYIKETHPLLRAKNALALVSDPKAHHGVMMERGLNWRDVYRDARILERKHLFDCLSIEEKALYRLADRYRAANRTAGRLFSCAPKSSLLHFCAKRDYLAWRLVNLAYSIGPHLLTEFASSYHLNADKLLQQHAQHTQRLAAVERCQTAYQQVVHAVRKIHPDESKAVALVSLQKAFTAIEIATQLQKSDRFESLNYALHAYGLSKDDFVQQMKGLPDLKSHLQALASLNNVDEKKITEKSTPQVVSVLQDMQTTYQRIDLNRLRDDLNARAEDVARHYLGDPKICSSTWRYGTNKGSLIVTIQGQKQGLWRDFQTNEGGDMLRLIAHATETTEFKEVLQEATRFLGGYSTYIQPTATTTQTIQSKSDVDAYTLQKIQKAQRIYQATHPIEGTLAQRYLQEHRGIQGDLYSKTFRYHPALKNWMTGDVYPALVVVARDDQDTVCGIQAIFLDPKTAKKAPLGNNTKLSRGLIGEGAIVHQGLPSGQVAFAEGPETALSVAKAHPDWTVYVTFGVANFDKVPLKAKSQRILLCADHDGRASGTAKSIERAAKILSQKGIDVWVAEPQKPDGQKKWDFNDSFIAQGVSQVKEDLDHAVLYRAGITQDSITKGIEDTLTTIAQLTQAFEVSVTQELTSTVEIHEASFESLLTRYVDMELEQTRLVNTMHVARSKDPKASRELSVQTLAHSGQIKAFAAEAIQHPNIKTELEKLKTIRPASLAQRGGFIAIRERISKGEWSKEDIQTILIQLRGKAQDQSRSRSQDRDRGGRSR
jgi:Ti-type conjugative transfer relaxase TraA